MPAGWNWNAEGRSGTRLCVKGSVVCSHENAEYAGMQRGGGGRRGNAGLAFFLVTLGSDVSRTGSLQVGAGCACTMVLGTAYTVHIYRIEY